MTCPKCGGAMAKFMGIFGPLWLCGKCNYQIRARNAQRGSGAIGWALLALAVLVVIAVTSSPSWNTSRVQTTYHECLAAAQTPVDAKACDPSAPTPAPR